MDHQKCFKCGGMKPLSEFYRHPKMANGRLGKCKECTKTDVSNNYRANRAHYADYERKRFQKPERRIAALAYQQKRRTQNPEKYFAHYAVSNAVRDGRLKKKPCDVCGNPKAQAHHDDYSKPLDVVWLCRIHHLDRHGKVAYSTLKKVTP